jgi:hypothetical protein
MFWQAWGESAGQAPRLLILRKYPRRLRIIPQLSAGWTRIWRAWRARTKVVFRTRIRACIPVMIIAMARVAAHAPAVGLPPNMIFVTILAAWLLADFVGGLLHWVEDRLLVRPSRFQWLRKIQLENTRHHQSPAAMLKLSWYGNIRQTLPASNIVAMALIALGAPLLIVLTVMGPGSRQSHSPLCARKARNTPDLGARDAENGPFSLV